jgi:ABC-type nitrate/sulfonate/bicarbonate transport system substrate-binding protein
MKQRAHNAFAAGILLGASLVLSAGQTNAQTKLEVSHFPGGGTWPILAGLENGYFAMAGLEIHLNPITSSMAQITGTLEGKYDLGMTAFDNVIAYDVNEGETKLAAPADLVAFLGGEGGSLHLITAPEVKTIESLKGKTLAVDAKSTGYAFVLYRIAAMHGVKPGDYQVLAVGSSQKRLDALTQGQAAGTLLSKPFDAFAIAKGFNDLATMSKLFPHYQSTVGFTRRQWAENHHDMLVAFIRAYVQGSLWLFDSAHKEGAIDLLLKSTPNLSRDQAENIYRGAVGPDGVMSPMAALDQAGIKTVVALRSEFGEPKKKLDARQFYDLSYYNAAIAQ